MRYPETPSADYRWPGMLLQTAFYRCCETMRVHFMVLSGINRTGWDTKLLLTSVLASFVYCISLCHTLKAQHCSLSMNGCLTRLLLTTRPCLTPPLPVHPPSIDSIHVITGAGKNHLKNQQYLTS